MPEPPAAPAAGTGVMLVGGTDSTFTVLSCALEPDPSEPAAARALVKVSGGGMTDRREPFSLQISRFATTVNGVVTYTDNISYADSVRLLQAQRIEVGGQVSDLRDPKASTPLIRTRDDGVSAAGLAGAPGDGADGEGIVALAVNLTC